MIKGCRRQFNLAALRRPAVHRHNVLHRLPLKSQDLLLLLLREATVLGPQRREAGIALDRSVAEPSEIEPHLEIQEIL